MQIARAHALKISSVSLLDDVVSCKLSTSNNMISLAIWCNKHLQIFQRLLIALALRVCAILMSVKKITRAY